MVTKDKHPWAVDLASALKRWLKENGYQHGTELADELGIPRSAWSSISSAQAISQRVEYYARLYLKTGLEQANPTSIPPRRRIVPKTGALNKVGRAWSEEQYREWMAKQEKEEQTPVVPSFGGVWHNQSPAPVPGSTVGSVLGGFIDSLVEQIVENLAAQLSEHLSGNLSPSLTSLPTGQLIEELYIRLLALVNIESAEEREEALAAILSDIVRVREAAIVLTLPPDERELAITDKKESFG